jgi:cyanoexosortase A
MINNLFNEKTDKTRLGLFAILSGIALIHTTLINRITSDSDQQLYVFIFWGGLLFLVWRRRNLIKVNSDIFSTIIGIFLVIIVLFKSINLFWFEAYFLRLLPMIAGLGIALMTSGFKNLTRFWREFIIIIFICLPGSYWENELVERYFYVSQSTAQFANFALWNFGFNSIRRGVYIFYENGAVLVNYSCTGTVIIILLIKLVCLLCLTFPVNFKKTFWLFLNAIFLGFTLGGIRVIILTLVVNNKPIFNYWHGSEGASIFSTISVIIFSWIASGLIQSKSSKKIKKKNKFDQYFEKL